MWHRNAGFIKGIKTGRKTQFEDVKRKISPNGLSSIFDFRLLFEVGMNEPTNDTCKFQCGNITLEFLNASIVHLFHILWRISTLL